MKARIIAINLKMILAVLASILFLILLFIFCMEQTEPVSTKKHQIVERLAIKEEKTNSLKSEVEVVSQAQEKEKKQIIELPEYTELPREYKGYPVVGKIEIPKLNLEKYILSETSEQALKIAVTKLTGPKANEAGNFCIAGHNYPQTFGNLKSLEIGDQIILTDTYSRKVTYQVYKNEKVLPEDVTCLSQETKQERELTLITCTLGAIKRNIIKAIELYD